jgi:hypothetical protein
MSWCSRRSALALLLPLFAAAAPCRAQRVQESELWGLAAASQPAFYGAGFGLAWRDDQRTRIAPALAVGALGDGRLGARADLAIHFLLDPWKRSGTAIYGGGGLSLAMGEGRANGYVMLVLGAENAPGGRGGSFVEIGVGGGVRLAIGYRWGGPRRGWLAALILVSMPEFYKYSHLIVLDIAVGAFSTLAMAAFVSRRTSSAMLKFRTPLWAAFMPLVPDASYGGRGVFSQTSTPAVRMPPMSMS